MTDPNIQTELDADGILLARIDMPNRAMNVFSRDMMDSLEALITRAQSDDQIKAVVLTSAKSAFLAGADLAMIQMFTERAASTGSTEELHDLFGHLGRLFRRLETNPKPFVAAINGLALGGGLEVCLACRERVVADDPSIQLGLPEIKLGLLPGAGGTQRLPHLIGTAKGLEMLLNGNPVAPAEALKLGLVDEVVPADQLVEAAKKRARNISRAQAPWDAPGATFDTAPFDFSNNESARAAIAKAVGISDYQLRHYPAYIAIIDCVVGGWSLPMTEAGEHEMRIFVELMRDPVAGNMVRSLFLNRQKAAKLGLLGDKSPLAEGDDAFLPKLREAKAAAKAANGNEDTKLLLGAAAALACWQSGKAGKAEPVELADVAAVNAGLYPSYTGGPFSWLRQTGAAHIATLAAKADPALKAALTPLSQVDAFLRA
ncbi:enoyl-CoA hydratase-related protein [Polycyclovorans algicola]|uniref:enoyl-CoA hydratase-related protein n=1 Tax=Polycyclovorans algicola TaxID=616992 RepID=UPI000693E510|nr:enoyl-CoA hydratase-related protein [Polycyclovorans algicola]